MPADSSLLGRSEVIAFVSTRDPSRAKSFYRDSLGLRFLSEDPFALVFDAFGTMLRISVVREMTPVTHTVLGWDVVDIEAMVEQLGRTGENSSATMFSLRMNLEFGRRPAVTASPGSRTPTATP